MKVNFIEIPEEYLSILGDVEEGTRIYKTFGTEIEYRKWFNVVLKITEGRIVSPGGVGMHCHVTRAGFHKKIKSGGLTAFTFHFTGYTKTLLTANRKEIIQRQCYMFIPICELESWEHEILTKKEFKRLENENFLFITRKHKLAKDKKLVWTDLRSHND